MISIRFENVKTFSVKGVFGSSMNILLPNLELLTIRLIESSVGESITGGFGEWIGDWADFMNNHNHLRAIEMLRTFNMGFIRFGRNDSF